MRPPSHLIRDATFGPFLIGKILSICGMWIQNIAAAVLMYQLTRSAFMVGTVTAAQFLGPLVLALWAGALTDRFDRRRMLIVGRLLSGGSVAALALALTLWGADGFGGVPVLLTAVLVMGIGVAISVPAMQALVPSLVPEADLDPALALGAVAPSIARTLGPTLGAGLLIVGGPALAFGVSASTHVIFVAVLMHVRGRPYERTGASIFGGLQYLSGNRQAALLTLGVAALGFGIDPVFTLTPSVSDQVTGGQDLVGLLVASFGAGGILFVAMTRLLRRWFSLRTLGVSGFWILALGLVAGGLGDVVLVSTAGYFVMGVGYMMAAVALNTRIQRRVPEELRGRVMALWGAAFLGSRPVAAMVNGSLAEIASTQTAFIASAAVIILMSRLAVARPRHARTAGAR